MAECAKILSQVGGYHVLVMLSDFVWCFQIVCQAFNFELWQPEQYIIGIFYELNGLTDWSWKGNKVQGLEVF
jgi:hypothetical protein